MMQKNPDGSSSGFRQCPLPSPLELQSSHFSPAGDTFSRFHPATLLDEIISVGGRKKRPNFDQILEKKAENRPTIAKKK